MVMAKRVACLCQEIVKMDVEKLISLIRSQPILYDRRHKCYRNLKKKAKIWAIIAITMNESSEVIRTKWKGLKDSYKKYQKQAESTGQSGKSANCTRYHKWCWAENLKFLENCGYRPSSKFKISSTSLHDCSLDAEQSPAIQLVSTTSIPTKPMLKPEIVYLESLETLSKDTVAELRYSTIAQTTPAVELTRPSDPLYKRRSSTTKRSYNKAADDGDRPQLKRAKCGEPTEAIDFLFKSYAETFKKFTAKKQVLLKLTLARLFADAELDEMREPSVVFSSESVADEHDYTLDLDLETSKDSPDSDISSID